MARREEPRRDQGVKRLADAFEIEIDRISPDPDQPRKDFPAESIERMGASLKDRGQIMPISVRFSPELGTWVIVDGERRWRGAMAAGLKVLKVVERKGSLAPGDLLHDQLVANLQREDLSPVDRARSFRKLMDLNGWSGNRLSQELHIAQPVVTSSLALLELPEAIRERVELEELGATAAYELSKIADPVVQEQLAAKVVEGQWTRNQVRDEVRKVTSKKGGAKNPGKGRSGKPKVRTDVVHNDAGSGYKFRVANRKGIDPATLRAALLRWADSLDSGIAMAG
jgi:ParB family chromosome partitioning protein